MNSKEVDKIYLFLLIFFKIYNKQKNISSVLKELKEIYNDLLNSHIKSMKFNFIEKSS